MIAERGCRKVPFRDNLPSDDDDDDSGYGGDDDDDDDTRRLGGAMNEKLNRV